MQARGNKEKKKKEGTSEPKFLEESMQEF